jgi:hypothetical protein
MWRVNAASDQPLGAEGTDLFDETYYRLDGTGPVSGDVSGVFSRLGTILSATVQLNGPADYIVAHWGGPRGGADIMYYVGGLFIDTPITLTLIPDDRAGRLGGISSITLFGEHVTPDSGTSVPDGGASLALFGIGLCGLVTFARCQKKS